MSRRLRGEVRVRVDCPFPERFLNLCAQRKLRFWDVERLGEESLRCTLPRRDYALLRLALGDFPCELRLERRRGAPYFLRRFRRRYALLFGLAFSALALFLSSFFIWDFTIEGNRTVSDEEILRSLERNGVKLGTFGFGFRSEDLRNHVLLEIPELSWIAVNVSGCQAHVQVRERVPEPEIADRRTPSNLVARRAGLVRSVEALWGEKLVLPGMTVEEGQILISGLEDTEHFGARLSASLGHVRARTWYTLSLRLPKTEVRKAAGEGEQTRYALIFGTHRVKFYPGSSIPAAECDTIRERTELRLFGLRLPVTLERETLRPYARREVPLPADALRAKGEAILRAYLESTLAEDAEIRSALCTLREEGDTVTVTLQAECEEEIGERVPILTEP